MQDPLADRPVSRVDLPHPPPRVTFGRWFDNPPPATPIPDSFAAIPPLQPVEGRLDTVPDWLFPKPMRPFVGRRRRQQAMQRAVADITRARQHALALRALQCHGQHGRCETRPVVRRSPARRGAAVAGGGVGGDRGDEPPPCALATFDLIARFSQALEPAERWGLVDALGDEVEQQAWSEIAADARLEWDQ